jgi:hypothetical protein
MHDGSRGPGRRQRGPPAGPRASRPGPGAGAGGWRLSVSLGRHPSPGQQAAAAAAAAEAAARGGPGPWLCRRLLSYRYGSGSLAGWLSSPSRISESGPSHGHRHGDRPPRRFRALVCQCGKWLTGRVRGRRRSPTDPDVRRP